MSYPLDDEFYTRLMKTIEKANHKQTEELKVEIENVRLVITEEIKKRNELETKYDNLKDKYEKLEKSLRKNNVLVFGLEQDPEENLLTSVTTKLQNYLNVELNTNHINDIYTIGKQQNKPIVIKFISYWKKLEVLKNCYKLKEINKSRNIKISIAEELTLEERHANRILRQHLNEAKAQKLNAYIKGNKLYVNDEVYTAQQLAANEEDSKLDKEEREEKVETIFSNSAPSTPNSSNKRKTPDEIELETNNPRKFKTIVKPPYVGRSSSRIQDKEGKIQKSGKQVI